MAAVVVLLLFIIAGVIVSNVFRGGSAPASSIVGDQRVDVEKPKATQPINRDFTFPLKDESGKDIGKITYTIQNAELRDEIVVKGQKATAVKGRTFLILNLKITNGFNQTIQINSRDYVRLIVDNSPERLAPDIHNDPVEVQAISTKFTRLGFPINDSDKNLVLQVGEIDGDKSDIKLNLQ